MPLRARRGDRANDAVMTRPALIHRFRRGDVDGEAATTDLSPCAGVQGLPKVVGQTAARGAPDKAGRGPFPDRSGRGFGQTRPVILPGTGVKSRHLAIPNDCACKAREIGKKMPIMGCGEAYGTAQIGRFRMQIIPIVTRWALYVGSIADASDCQLIRLQLHTG